VTDPPIRDGIHAEVDATFDEMVDTRRTLDAHPELSFEEHATTKLVRDRMGALGLVERPVATPTGAAFELEGGRPGRTVVLRADIDARPCTRSTWASDPTLMGACTRAATTPIRLPAGRGGPHGGPRHGRRRPAGGP